jgi:hypothetical protein
MAGLVRSPWWRIVPPVYAPYVPVDLRLLAPFAFVAGGAAASRVLAWPAPGLVPPAAAISVALVARLPASTILLVSTIPLGRSGLAADPVGLAASVGSVLVALHLGLEAAGEEARTRLRRRGVPREEVEVLGREGRTLARSSLRASALVTGGLVAAVTVAGGLIREETLPLAEVMGFVLVLAVAAVVADWRGLALEG